jgi:hypothetical protein
MTQLSPGLARLGDALEQAATADLESSAPRRRRKRRLLVLVPAIVVLIPGAAIGAKLLTGSDAVAQSMPAGAAILANTDPTCTVVKQDVEYHCVLARRPAPEVSDFKGTVYETVDATKHVNGGCRSLTSDGLVWECYLGQAAVDEKIISQGFLGEVELGPSRG